MAAVVNPDNRIALKKLTIGRDFGNSVEVLEGVAPPDAVVINPARFIGEWRAGHRQRAEWCRRCLDSRSEIRALILARRSADALDCRRR